MADTRLARIEQQWASYPYLHDAADHAWLIEEVNRKNEALGHVLAYFKTLGWIRGTAIAETVERALEEPS